MTPEELGDSIVAEVEAAELDALEVTAQAIACMWAAAPRQVPTNEILDALQAWHPNIDRFGLASLVGVASTAVAKVEQAVVTRFAATKSGRQ